MLHTILLKHDFEPFTIVKSFLPVVLLFNAAIQDFRHRELDASAWVPIIILGIFSLGFELLASLNVGGVVTRLGVTIITLSLPYFLRLYELGDAIIVIGLSLTHISTTRPFLGGGFLRTLFPDFGLTVLWNTEIIMLLIVLSKRFLDLVSENWWEIFTNSKLLHARITHGITLKAVKENKREGSFLKQKIPLVTFILPGYAVTILFGSLIPPFFQPLI
ncbi:MAG: hypothetical protein QXT26_03055 [Thermoproteota archaeon]